MVSLSLLQSPINSLNAKDADNSEGQVIPVNGGSSV